MKRLAPVPGQGFFFSFQYVERLAHIEATVHDRLVTRGEKDSN